MKETLVSLLPALWSGFAPWGKTLRLRIFRGCSTWRGSGHLKGDGRGEGVRTHRPGARWPAAPCAVGQASNRLEEPTEKDNRCAGRPAGGPTGSEGAGGTPRQVRFWARSPEPGDARFEGFPDIFSPRVLWFSGLREAGSREAGGGLAHTTLSSLPHCVGRRGGHRSHSH